MRTFLTLSLSESVHSALCAQSRFLKERISRQGVRFAAEDKIHLTLQFLGNVLEEEIVPLRDQLRQVCGTLTPVELTVGGLGGFPDLHRPKVIWVGAQGPELAELAQTVRSVGRNLPEADQKPFSPHITIARISPGSKEVGRIVQGLLPYREPDVQCESGSVQFIQTQPDGSYQVIDTFLLGG